jgi:cell division protein FtsQ
LQSLINPYAAGTFHPASVDGVRFQPRRAARPRREPLRAERSIFGWFKSHSALASRVGFLACLAFYGMTVAYGVVAGGHWDDVRGTVTTAANDAAIAAGFDVKAVRVEGRQNLKEQQIAAALGPYKGQSIFAFDTDAARERLKAEGWVSEARVMRLLPSTLVVELEERTPFALWQDGGVMAVIDDKGRALTRASRAEYPELPVISGPGAAVPSREIVEALAAQPELKAQVQDIQRVAGRRWDLVLLNGLRVKLPGDGFAPLLTELSAIVTKSPGALYEISEMDFRVPAQFTVRLKDESDQGREKFLSWLTAANAPTSQGL